MPHVTNFPKSDFDRGHDAGYHAAKAEGSAPSATTNTAIREIALCLRALVVAIDDGFDSGCAAVLTKQIDAVVAQLPQ